MLSFDSPVILHASQGRPVSVDVLAYAGGVMNVPPLGEVAIDLAGLEMNASFPLLVDHESALDGVLGSGIGKIVDGQLAVGGTLAAAHPGTAKILALHRAGVTFQASVGVTYDRADTRRIPAGETIQLNGRALSSPRPFTLVSRGLLREVSITSLGCDPATSVRIAASFKGKTNMTPETIEPTTNQPTAETAVAAERDRVGVIMAAAKKFNVTDPAILEASIKHDTTADLAELRFLRATRPQGPSVNVGRGAPVSTVETLTAALLVKGGKAKTAETEYGDQVMQASQRYQHASLVDICRMALSAEGRDASGSTPAMIKAALSTQNLQDTFSNVANKFLVDAYRETPATWRSFAAVRQTNDFKLNTGIRPNLTGQLEKLGPGGEVKHAGLGEAKFTWSVDTFAKQLSLDRRDIINDDLGTFQDAATAMGRMAQRAVSDLVYSTLLGATSTFFDAGLANSGTQALSIAGLSAAYTAMMTQRDAEGNDLDLRPSVLLVPPELRDTAMQLMTSEEVVYLINPTNAPTSATAYPAGNPAKNSIAVQVEPRLSNTAKFANADTNAWYLLGSSADAPMIVAFLNGVQVPTVEFFNFSSDPDRLAATWRVYMDFGCSLGDYRAAIKENPA